MRQTMDALLINDFWNVMSFFLLADNKARAAMNRLVIVESLV